MKIKLLDSFSGPDVDWKIGDVVDVIPSVGKRLIKLKLAEPNGNGTDTQKPPKLKIYDGDRKKTVDKSTLSDRKGERKIIKATLS